MQCTFAVRLGLLQDLLLCRVISQLSARVCKTRTLQRLLHAARCLLLPGTRLRSCTRSCCQTVRVCWALQSQDARSGVMLPMKRSLPSCSSNWGAGAGCGFGASVNACMHTSAYCEQLHAAFSLSFALSHLGCWRLNLRGLCCMCDALAEHQHRCRCECCHLLDGCVCLRQLLSRASGLLLIARAGSSGAS